MVIHWAKIQSMTSVTDCNLRDGKSFRLIVVVAVHALCISSAAAQSTADPQPPAGSTTQDARDRVFYSTETERFKPLVNKLARNVVLDQKDIWTSPLHMTKKTSVPWILTGVALGGLIATDRWSSRQLPNTVDQVSVSGHVSNLGAWYTVLPLTGGLYIGGAIAHNDKAREAGVLSGEAILDTVIVTQVLKAVTRRERPTNGRGNGAFFQGGSSFPSGHAAASFAFASVFAHEYNKNIWYPLGAYGLATAVSLSRLSGRNHFPSDIFAGAAIGWFIGRYVFQTHVDHSIHRRSDSKFGRLRPAITPQIDGETRAVVLSWETNSRDFIPR
jgi:hypothetical protein